MTNATTTTSLCNFNFLTMHVVPTEHQAPFVKVIIGLVRHQAPSFKSFNLSGINPPSLDYNMQLHNLNATTTTSWNHIKSTTKDLHINVYIHIINHQSLTASYSTTIIYQRIHSYNKSSIMNNIIFNNNNSSTYTFI